MGTSNSSTSSSSSSTSSDSGTFINFTQEEAAKKADEKISPGKRSASSQKLPGAKRRRKTKNDKSKKSSAKKEASKNVLPLTELVSTEPKSPLSTSPTDDFDYYSNEYCKDSYTMRNVDENQVDPKTSGSNNVPPSTSQDKPKLKSVIIRKNPNYYIKKAPSSDDSD